MPTITTMTNTQPWITYASLRQKSLLYKCISCLCGFSSILNCKFHTSMLGAWNLREFLKDP